MAGWSHSFSASRYLAAAAGKSESLSAALPSRNRSRAAFWFCWLTPWAQGRSLVRLSSPVWGVCAAARAEQRNAHESRARIVSRSSLERVDHRAAELLLELLGALLLLGEQVRHLAAGGVGARLRLLGQPAGAAAPRPCCAPPSTRRRGRWPRRLCALLSAFTSSSCFLRSFSAASSASAWALARSRSFSCAFSRFSFACAARPPWRRPPGAAPRRGRGRSPPAPPPRPPPAGAGTPPRRG